MYRVGGHEAPLASQHYPKLQTIHFALAAHTTPQDYVLLVLSSITSAPVLSEVSFVFTRTILHGDLDLAMNGTEWRFVDDQLSRLAQQATGEVTISFDFLIQPGWTPRADGTGMGFMRRFRRLGVMRLRGFGEDVAAYYPST